MCATKCSLLYGMSSARTQLSQRGANEVRYYQYPGESLAPFVSPNGGWVEWPYAGSSLEASDASGGWVGSAIDLTRFLTAFDGTRGEFLSPDMLVELTAKPSLLAPNPTPAWNGTQRSDGWYGLGIFLQPDVQDLTWWHWGNMLGR